MVIFGANKEKAINKVYDILVTQIFLIHISLGRFF